MQIYYLYTKKNNWPIESYLGLWGNIQFWNILPITYESFIKKKKYPLGLYIFSDLELLLGKMKNEVITIYNHLKKQKEGYYFLNHPEHSLSRVPLLQALYKKGLNVFNIYKANEDLPAMTFPIFFRKANDHEGPQTPLLTSHHQVQNTIKELQSKNEDLDEWIVTEFCDVSDQNGIFRKYSSFRIGQHIIPRHIFFSTDWIQKLDGNLGNPDFLREETHFLQKNLYKEQLLNIFNAARITYGRIDFGIIDGKVQTWEINTNPSIIHHSHVSKNPRLENHKIFFKNFSSALKSYIDQPPESPFFGTYLSDRITFTISLIQYRKIIKN